MIELATRRAWSPRRMHSSVLRLQRLDSSDARVGSAAAQVAAARGQVRSSGVRVECRHARAGSTGAHGRLAHGTRPLDRSIESPSGDDNSLRRMTESARERGGSSPPTGQLHSAACQLRSAAGRLGSSPGSTASTPRTVPARHSRLQSSAGPEPTPPRPPAPAPTSCTIGRRAATLMAWTDWPLTSGAPPCAGRTV